MRRLPAICVVDTNVPKTANRSINPANIPDDLVDCVDACVDAIEHVINSRGLVLDDGDEIFEEYRRQLKMKGQPGVGDRFMKWVHDNRWRLPAANRVKITKTANSYLEFPAHVGLSRFDPSDHKFLAVANAHPEKPAILQAVDSKWWGFKDALTDAGITVHFLCESYTEKKYTKKMKQ